ERVLHGGRGDLESLHGELDEHQGQGDREQDFAREGASGAARAPRLVVNVSHSGRATWVGSASGSPFFRRETRREAVKISNARNLLDCRAHARLGREAGERAWTTPSWNA